MTKTAIASRTQLVPHPRRDRQSLREIGLASPADQILTTQVGLMLPADVSFEDWAQAGRKLTRIASTSAWCLGDWLAHGQQRFRGRYRRVAEEAGLDNQTLRNYAWIARKFTRDRRRPGLSLQHHAEVASMSVPEQDHWLERAEDSSWSRNMLRRQIRSALDGKPAEPAVPTVRADAPVSAYLPRLKVDRQDVGRWRGAAQRSDTDLHTWILRALNTAAGASGNADPVPTGPSRRRDRSARH